MTKCDECGKEVGKLYCAKCRAKKAGMDPQIHFKGLIPLLYWDPVKKRYLFGCTVALCPNNRDGFCVSEHFKLPIEFLHEFDGDNIIKQMCG